METKLFKHTFVNLLHNMKDGITTLCEPLEIVEMDGKLIAFFILN